MTHAPPGGSRRSAAVRGVSFGVFQTLGWAAVLFNGCVAQSCQEFTKGDQIGAGLIFVLALGLMVLAATGTSTVLGVLSTVAAWPSRVFRWVGIVLVAAGLIAAVGAARAVRSSYCVYDSSVCS